MHFSKLYLSYSHCHISTSRDFSRTYKLLLYWFHWVSVCIGPKGLLNIPNFQEKATPRKAVYRAKLIMYGPFLQKISSPFPHVKCRFQCITAFKSESLIESQNFVLQSEQALQKEHSVGMLCSRSTSQPQYPWLQYNQKVFSGLFPSSPGCNVLQWSRHFACSPHPWPLAPSKPEPQKWQVPSWSTMPKTLRSNPSSRSQAFYPQSPRQEPESPPLQ